MPTIKELAERCNTHKTGIRRTIDRLGLADELARDENGVIQIPDHVTELVLQQYQNTKETEQDTQEQQAEQYQTATEQTLLVALDALREQLAVKDRQIADQQQTIATLTAALSNAQALTAGSLQALHHLTAPTTVVADRAEGEPEEQAQPESVPVEHEAPQPHSDRPDKPKTSGEKKDGETVTPQSKPVERPTEAPQGRQEPKRGVKKEQTRKGLWGLFKRK